MRSVFTLKLIVCVCVERERERGIVIHGRCDLNVSLLTDRCSPSAAGTVPFQVIIPFISQKDEFLKAISMLTLAYIVEEEENGQLIDDTGKQP